MANRKRNKQIKFYLSDDEYKLFSEQVKKSNLSQTDFFIKCITKKRIIVVDGLKEISMELRKIGINLNQISRNLNSSFFQNADNELKEIKQIFSNTSDKVIEILKGVE